MLNGENKLKFVLITSAFVLLILIVLSNVFNIKKVSEKDIQTYKQGMEYLKKEDRENAFYNFSNIPRNSTLYEIALLRQALCADELGDNETAVKKYKLFVEKYTDSIFVQKAYYALAQNYYRNKDFNKAERIFSAIQKTYKDSDYAIASNYYLGLIEKEFLNKKIQEDKNLLENKEKITEQKEKIKNYLYQYIELVPDGRFNLQCAEEILALGIPLKQKEYSTIGQIFYKNNLYQKAYENLNKGTLKDGWGYLSLTMTKLKKYQEAQKIFEQGYINYSKTQTEEDLEKFIYNYATLNQTGIKDGLLKAYEISNQYKIPGGDYALYSLLQYSPNEKDYLYEKIYTKYPTGKYASDALSNLFWNAYSKGQYKDALRLGRIHLKNYQYTNSSPKIIFWMGKLSEIYGNKNEAKGLYRKILEIYPDDYYAYRAYKKLSLFPNSGWKTKSTHKLPEEDSIIEFPIEYTQIPSDHISILDAISQVGDYELLAEIDPQNKAIQSWVNYKRGKYQTAAILARDFISDLKEKPKFDNPIYKLAYQLHYQEFINDNAKHYKLDPFLITALIREESYFNTNAGSSVGAVGLMQLMPSTASYIASKKNIVYRGRNSLTDPDTNITLGCAYLNYTKHQLNENDLLAVASYNGGPNAVKNWKNNMSYRSFDEFIENIPYPETKEYVKKVYRSYWVYLNIYG